jgi:hypothetical protein
MASQHTRQYLHSLHFYTIKPLKMYFFLAHKCVYITNCFSNALNIFRLPSGSTCTNGYHQNFKGGTGWDSQKIYWISYISFKTFFTDRWRFAGSYPEIWAGSHLKIIIILVLILVLTFSVPTGARVLSRIWKCVTIDGVWIGEWVYWLLIYNTRNYTLEITIWHTTSSLSVTVFTSRYLVTDINNGYSSASVLKSRTVLLSTVNWTLSLTNQLLHVTSLSRTELNRSANYLQDNSSARTTQKTPFF